MADEKNNKSKLMSFKEFIDSLQGSGQDSIDITKATPGLKKAYDAYVSRQKSLKKTVIQLTEKDGKFSK